MARLLIKLTNLVPVIYYDNIAIQGRLLGAQEHTAGQDNENIHPTKSHLAYSILWVIRCLRCRISDSVVSRYNRQSRNGLGEIIHSSITVGNVHIFGGIFSSIPFIHIR
jgi:hypothetical protein